MILIANIFSSLLKNCIKFIFIFYIVVQYFIFCIFIKNISYNICTHQQAPPTATGGDKANSPHQISSTEVDVLSQKPDTQEDPTMNRHGPESAEIHSYTDSAEDKEPLLGGAVITPATWESARTWRNCMLSAWTGTGASVNSRKQTFCGRAEWTGLRVPVFAVLSSWALGLLLPLNPTMPWSLYLPFLLSW